MSNLSRRVDDIALSGDLADRVSAAGNDEVSALAGEINRMLVSLETLEMERKTAAESLRKACMLQKRLLDEGFPDLSVSVNVSARTFMEPDFAEKELREPGVRFSIDDFGR